MHDRSTSGAGQLEGVRTIVRPEGAHPLGRTRVSKQLTYLKSSYEEFYNRKSRRELVQARRCRTGERVYFRVEEDDRVESLPRSWTDLARPDPFVEQAGGRAGSGSRSCSTWSTRSNPCGRESRRAGTMCKGHSAASVCRFMPCIGDEHPLRADIENAMGALGTVVPRIGPPPLANPIG